MCYGLLQVESTQGTPLANTADVSLQVKTDSADEATITALQLTNLFQNGTAMSVSISPFSFVSLPSSCLVFAFTEHTTCRHAHTAWHSEVSVWTRPDNSGAPGSQPCCSLIEYKKGRSNPS